MKVAKVFSAIAAAILLVVSASASAAPQTSEFVEGVDWTRQVITVTGEGIVPQNAVNYTQAKHMAATAAKADAYRKLGELINGVRVEGETTVESMLTTQDTIKMRVSATIKGAKIVSETFLSDGGYRVVVQVPLFGVSNSLASAVFERTTEIEPFPAPVFDVEPSTAYGSPLSRQADLPAYTSPLARKSLPTLDAIILQKMQANWTNAAVYQPTVNAQVPYESPSVMPKRSVEDYASAAEGDYTGLIVDCRGLELQPVMSPVIQNSNGTKIYGHKNLDIDKVISMGMASYAVDASDQVSRSRAGNNPLVVKAKSLANFNSNPVLSVPDSNRVLIENYVTKFLKDLKVVFLLDEF